MPAPLPPVLAQPAGQKVAVRKQPMTTSQIICLFCIIFFAAWTILWVVISISAIYGISQSEVGSAVTGDDKYKKAGATLGLAIGFGMYFVIWLAGVIPTFVIFIFARLSIKSGKSQSINNEQTK